MIPHIDHMFGIQWGSILFFSLFSAKSAVLLARLLPWLNSNKLHDVGGQKVALLIDPAI